MVGCFACVIVHNMHGNWIHEEIFAAKLFVHALARACLSKL